jgi:hypothetical protein
MSFRWRESLVAMVSWHYATHAAMVALALMNEPRPAPSLPDERRKCKPRFWLPVAGRRPPVGPLGWTLGRCDCTIACRQAR